MASSTVGVLRGLTHELRELDIGATVPRVASLSPLEFLRDYVAPNKPVVFTDAISHWPALRRWSEAHLIAAAGVSSPVTVALTPDGRADCPATLPDGRSCFALPHQQRATLGAFFDLLRASQQWAPGSQEEEILPPLVPYLQFQNSSLTAELPQLRDDIDLDFEWAHAAFGGPPEAVNFWAGGRQTITSWHKDPFQNIYSMVLGQKTFRLLPPTDGYRMALRRYPLAIWRPAEGEGETPTATATTAAGPEIVMSAADFPKRLKLELSDGVEDGSQYSSSSQVLWSSVPPRPLFPDSSRFPTYIADDDDGGDGVLELYEDPELPLPLVVTLIPGETLYLPAGWWHEVHHGGANMTSNLNGEGREGQAEVAIAVNHWYDMRFDERFAAVKALEELAVAAGLNEMAPDC